MSSEIRSGNERTYWILSNGTGYIDGVTDAGLVTTVGNGWHIYWIGSDHAEYVAACVAVGIVPRNSDSNTPTVSELPIETDPLFLIQNLSDKIKELEEQKSKIEKIDTLSNNIDQINDTVSTITNSVQQTVSSIIDSTVTDLSAKQEDTAQKLDTLGYVVPGVRISARQARLWLIQNGIEPSVVESTIDSVEDPILRESIRVEWEYATYVERNYPWLTQLCSVLGLTEQDLDRAFIEAPLI